jgi:signal transduction histidine kinase
MRSRPRRGALGLRGRIVGAVLVTTVATLAVAALELVGPLQSQLRNAELKTLKAELGRSATASFKQLDLFGTAKERKARDALRVAQQQLATRVGAVVTVLGYPGADGYGNLLLDPKAEGDIAESDPFDDVAAAFRSGRPQYTFGSLGGTQYARAALPFKDQGLTYVLAVHRPIAEIPGAVHAVRTAFLTAALVALALTLIIGIPLAATLVRRLRRLRAAALQLAREGPAVEVPVDRARDEVGDLARSFATMQSQLQHQEEARRAFVATASHELRTPLTSLEGMLELLEDDLQTGDHDPGETLALLERARAQSRRLSRLAADLLDLSRLDAEVALRSEPVELGELSRAVLAEFELGTSERGITTALDDAGGSVWALGDPGSVARILRILLDNAVRATPDDTEIRVELHGGSAVSISVSDVGPGITPEDREVIFKRFQRGRATGGQAGFGLGLAIGRELAERMGGDLSVDPEYAAGARFTLTLPAARAPEHETATVSG